MHTYLFEKWSPFVDINECAMGLDGCADNAACTDTDGSYECTCNSGFAGDGFTCTSTLILPMYKCCFMYQNCCCSSDIDECSTIDSPCHTNATCTDTVGSFVCQCVQGFSGNGIICEGSRDFLAISSWNVAK